MLLQWRNPAAGRRCSGWASMHRKRILLLRTALQTPPTLLLRVDQEPFDMANSPCGDLRTPTPRTFVSRTRSASPLDHGGHRSLRHMDFSPTCREPGTCILKQHVIVCLTHTNTQAAVDITTSPQQCEFLTIHYPYVFPPSPLPRVWYLPATSCCTASMHGTPNFWLGAHHPIQLVTRLYYIAAIPHLPSPPPPTFPRITPRCGIRCGRGRSTPRCGIRCGRGRSFETPCPLRCSPAAPSPAPSAESPHPHPHPRCP
jgi:hypothetical protein